MNDDTFWDLATCGCLGCLLDALNTGMISEASYDKIADMEHEQQLERVPCPGCGKQGYVMMYELDLMHCPSCGLYSELTLGGWLPFRHGQPWVHDTADAVATQNHNNA